MKITNPTLRRILTTLIAVALVFGANAPAATQSGSTFYITDVDAAAFPQVQFKVRALDLENHTIGNLTALNLAIYENGQQVPADLVQVTAHDDGPLNVVFVVDLGAQSNYTAILAAMREAITRFVDGGFFVDERDSVRLLVRENPGAGDRTTSKLGPTRSGRELVDFVSSYTFPRSRGRTKGIEGVNDALAGMRQMVNEPGMQDAAIIFLTRAIEEPRANVALTGAQNTAADAKTKYVVVHAIQPTTGTPDQPALQVLAQGSGGVFTNMRPNAVAVSVDTVYRALSAQRRYYTISYASAITESGPRVVTVGSPQKPAAGKSGEYTVDIAPPRVALTLQSTQLRRNPLPGVFDVSSAYSPLKVKADVAVSWADGTTRGLRSVELLVDGAKREERTASQLPSGTTEFAFDVDLSSITAPGINTAMVSVRVVDDLGNEASAQQSVGVDVAPVPTPTPEPEPGLMETSGGIIIVLVFALLAAVGVAVFFFLRQRNSTPKPRQSAAAPLATLIVLDGPSAMMGTPVYVTRPKVVLGRDPTATDIAFYAGEASSVGRKHAILAYDGKGFTITDNGSSNGTRVNNKKLTAGVPETLRDGDEITLGDVRNRGLRARFAIGDGAHWVKRDNVTHAMQ